MKFENQIVTKKELRNVEVFQANWFPTIFIIVLLEESMLTANDHLIEFHLIEIVFFHLIEISLIT